MHAACANDWSQGPQPASQPARRTGAKVVASFQRSRAAVAARRGSAGWRATLRSAGFRCTLSHGWGCGSKHRQEAHVG